MIKSQRGFSKDIVIIGIILASVVFLLLGTIFLNRNKNVGTGQEFSPTTGPALLNNSSELYRSLNNDRYFLAFSYDLGEFGRKTIDKYKDNKEENIVFEISSPIVKNNNTYSFEGFYAVDKKLIKVNIETLNNDRIHTSISNKNGDNIDDELPSNSKRNTFIATLPYESNEFSINYFSKSDDFSITLYEDSTLVRSLAVKALSDGVGYNINDTEYYIIVPTSAGSGIEE